ncbi:MAG: glutaredoxin domain-containing protein [Gammaproteobacteria bacterium]|nr:glutaredoxin domain-containing protein [Gammaproteobacteria bacterium]
MRKLVIITAIVVAGWYWQTGSLPLMAPAGAFDQAGNPVTWLFTVENCGRPCDMGRDNLNNRRVEFEEKLIDPNNSSDPNVDLWKQVGKGGFPLIVSGDIRIEGSGDQSMIRNMLGTNYGDRYFTSFEKRLFKQHFYPDGTPKIIMYGADWCPHCKKLREEFKANDVDFIEIDVEKSAYKSQIIKTMEIPGYPAVWVGYTRVNGTDLRAVEKVRKTLGLSFL